MKQIESINLKTKLKEEKKNQRELEPKYKSNGFEFDRREESATIQKQISLSNLNQITQAKKSFKKLIENGLNGSNKNSSRLTDRSKRNKNNLAHQQLSSIIRNDKNQNHVQTYKNVSKVFNFTEPLESHKLINYILENQIKNNPKQIHDSCYHKDKFIKVPSTKETVYNNKESSLWLGQVYDRCVSSAFKFFTSHDLDYKQTKSYCCQQILINILQQIRQRAQAGHIYRIQDQINNGQILSKKNNIIYQTEPMKFYNEQSSQILGYLCSKYPQTNISGANKQISEIADSIKIDNWANDEYDILRLSPIKFVYKENGDYSKQIMLFLNFLMSQPFKKHRNHSQLTNFRYFEKVISKIFSIVYFKDTGKDLQKILTTDKQFNYEAFSKKNLTQQEQQYMQKVKKFTSYQIGSKIPGTAKLFSEEDIRSGIIKVEDNAVSRVIDKWVEQLGSKFFQADKNILNRTYRFKSEDSKTFNKLRTQSKEQLYKIICQKRKKLERFMKELKQSLYDLSGNLANSSRYDSDQLHYISQRERILGQFAVKMSQSSSQYFIQILQKQIGLLIECVEQLKQRWVSKYKYKQSPLYESLCINLITFKIGDLLRCKITSNEAQIARVLKIFITLNQMWDSRLIKIIRVKNRLDSGTRDILINFMFDQLCPCQIQLCVTQSNQQKQYYFDKFNHFLYELKRANLGPIIEMCKIWRQYDGKAQTYIKKIQKQTKKNIQKKTITEQFKKFDINDQSIAFQYKFPFICSSCKIFYPRQTNIYFPTRIYNNVYCGNCWVVKAFLESDKIAVTKKLYIFRRYLSRYPNFFKLVNNLEELSSIYEILDNSFLINIPIHSRIAHMEISLTIILNREDKKDEQKTQDQFAFVSTTLTDQGQLKKQMCSGKVKKTQINSSMKSSGSTESGSIYFDQNYIFYGWKMPTKLMPLPKKKDQHYLEMIEKLMPQIRKLQQSKGSDNVKVCGVEIQKDKFYFLPFFVIDDDEISNQVIIDSNKNTIMSFLEKKNQILEIQNKKITQQFQNLPLNIKLKMAYSIKQIYLNKNQLKKITFIQNFHVLQIFQAHGNLITEIPLININLKQLKLAQNRIQVINQFTKPNQEYKLKILNLSYNQIAKIQNIEYLINLEAFWSIRCKVNKMEGFPINISNIALGFNQISKIQGLENLNKLQRLNLASNLIEKIENLQNCKKLSVLMLSRNKIMSIENLQKLQNLTILHLSNTGLSNSEIVQKCSNGLRKQKKLKRILFENNNIKCLFRIIGFTGQSQFKINQSNVEQYSYLEMQEVSVAQNQLMYIDNISKIMPYLKILNIKKNKIKSIVEIENLSFLEQLDASQNQIQDIPNEGWTKLTKIRVINLAHNRIREIPDLKVLLFVKDLNFQDNLITQIKNFPFWTFGQPDFARKINLQQNRLFYPQTSNQHFQVTLNALKLLTTQSEVNLLNNGNSQEKLCKIEKLKEQFGFKLTFFEDSLI